MERKTYSFLIGAALLAGSLAAAFHLNAAVGQTGGGVIPLNSTDKGGDPRAACNFTVTEQRLGNGTVPASIPTPIDTTQLRMHVDEANRALQASNTQGAMTHVILALEEIETILGGNATSTANATDTTMGNSTSIGPLMP
jgi:hypothetical protein